MRQDYARLQQSFEAAMQFARSNANGYDGGAIDEIKQMIREQGQYYEQSLGKLMAEFAALKHSQSVYPQAAYPQAAYPSPVYPPPVYPSQQCCNNERTSFEPSCCGGVPAVVERHERTIYEGGMNNNAAWRQQRQNYPAQNSLLRYNN